MRETEPALSIIVHPASAHWAVHTEGAGQPSFRESLSKTAVESRVCAGLPSLWHPDVDPLLCNTTIDDAWLDRIERVAADAPEGSALWFDHSIDAGAHAIVPASTLNAHVFGFPGRHLRIKGEPIEVSIDTLGRLRGPQGPIRDTVGFLRNHVRCIGSSSELRFTMHQILSDPFVVQAAAGKRDEKLRKLVGQQPDNVGQMLPRAFAMSSAAKEASWASRGAASDLMAAEIMAADSDVAELLGVPALKDDLVGNNIIPYARDLAAVIYGCMTLTPAVVEFCKVMDAASTMFRSVKNTPSFAHSNRLPGGETFAEMMGEDAAECWIAKSSARYSIFQAQGRKWIEHDPEFDQIEGGKRWALFNHHGASFFCIEDDEFYRIACWPDDVADQARLAS